MQIFLLILLAVATVVIVAMLAKEQHTVKKTLISAGCGICSLGTINLLSTITGIAVSVNYITCFVAAVLSIPGVVLLVVLQLLFNI